MANALQKDNYNTHSILLLHLYFPCVPRKRTYIDGVIEMQIVLKELCTSIPE